MGAQFAVELALQEPELVVGAILMGPVVETGRKSVPRQALSLISDAMFSESLSCNAIVLSDYFRAGLRWYLTELPVMMEYPLKERVAAVRQPVLLLRGGKDPLSRRPWCEELTAAAPLGSMGEVSGQGHVFQHTAPETAAEIIVGWIKAVNGFGLTA